MVSIAAFQAVVPGSIPGRRIVYVTISFYLNLTLRQSIGRISVPCGLVARIAGFHPAGPGSIPGMGDEFYTNSP